MKNDYPKNFKDLISPIKKELVITVLLAVLGTFPLFIAPIAVTVSINRYLNGDTEAFFTWVIAAALGLVLKQILHMLSLGYAHLVEARFRYKLRKDFSTKLSRLPLGFFSETSSGAIRKLISVDTIKIHTVVAHGFSEISAGLALPISCILIMLVFEWRTGLLITALIVLILFITVLWMNKGNTKQDEINKRYELAQREMSHSIIEMVDGIKEIKNFGLGGSLFKRFDDALSDFSNTSFEWLSGSAKAYSFLMSAIQPTAMLFLSLLVCLFSISNGWLSPEYAILFMLLSISLPSSIIALMQIGNHMKDGVHSINTILDLYAKNDQVFKDDSSDFLMGDIAFKDVSFSYDGENDVLKDINCTIEDGSLTALVGASGSGKTTMARLIARFWDVNTGSVSIGGVNIKDLSEKEMLSNISIVFQDVALMNASIAENIAISKKDATMEEIISAAKSAFIHDRIMKLPEGYESIYGEENVVLSGGEKQRLTIARAFLANAPIILLDEATVQADAQSEVEIQKALSLLRENKTVIMIAHRLSSIVNADKILVFDKGKIIEYGTHKELLKEEGIYKEMWLAQNDIGRDC